MVKKKIDPRVRTLVENGVTLRQRTMFVLVGDRGRDQVVNLHYMLSKAMVSQEDEPIRGVERLVCVPHLRLAYQLHPAIRAIRASRGALCGEIAGPRIPPTRPTLFVHWSAGTHPGSLRPKLPRHTAAQPCVIAAQLRRNTLVKPWATRRARWHPKGTHLPANAHSPSATGTHVPTSSPH